MDLSPQVMNQLITFIDKSKNDSKVEVECKLLSGKIQTKDIVDRLLKEVTTSSLHEEYHLTITYADGIRVTVEGVANIQKLSTTNSFKEVPLIVERKQKCDDNDIALPETCLKFCIRSEHPVRKDWEGNPSDSKGHIRLISRKSFKTTDELFRIDFSAIKSRPLGSKQTLRDMFKQPPTYELEIEFIGKKSMIDNKVIANELIRLCTKILQAYYQSPFLLSVSDIQRYQQEFKMTSNLFLNPVTLFRRHLRIENIHSILKDYTVTNKADGLRCGIYVARDRRLIRVTPNYQVTWTGITALDDSHSGDFLDGEYIPDKKLFCIFDIYRFRNADVRNLPLMKSDEDTLKNPLKSRLGCARTFIEDLKTQFEMVPSLSPIRIETKTFLAGDGVAMEECIKNMLNTEFEYETDGLIFTPRNSRVAPSEDRKGKTWLRVYKWKPPHLNTIDFLIKLNEETFDPVNRVKAKKGELYVSRTPGDDIIYPRETMTGEYIPRKLPSDLQKIAESNTRVPSVFQPTVPRDPDAYQILVPLNDKNQAIDSKGSHVEDNTIVECAFDIETRRWKILHTRYDKTYQYRVLREPQYGNDIATANSVWTSIHVPITDKMIKTFVSNPPDDTYEDDMYYRDDLKRCSRVFNDVYDFHNRIKDMLYRENVTKGDTLLELAVGRAGDLNKWKRVSPSKVVGVDISLSNITSPTQGSAVRYLNDKKKNPRDNLPPCLFIEGDMTHYPLFEEDDKYMPILTGKETASTDYLKHFENLNSFDTVSCQFALHYACESEETFRNFAKNLEKYGNAFFGTCSDGKSIYTLLAGKTTHLFGSDKQACGEYSKKYDDRETWVEEFGMPVMVYLESFDKPAIEYLVPFEKVTTILEEYGYILSETKLFSEIYSNQTNIVLTSQQQEFSFLNRTFVFKKTKVKKSKKEDTSEPEPEVKEKRKLKKVEGIEPVLFSGFDESKGEYRNFSNMSNHKIIVDGKNYDSVEHYYHAKKSELFKDDETLEKILKAKTPKAVKSLGKKVKNFVQEEWDKAKESIMSTGVKTKFSQHPELQKQLQDTKDRKIGYADARDIFWGIGTSMDVDRSKHPEKWRGKNKLGEILMNLRN
jgi:ribA/ribD-fused uncharacterized protein